MEPYMIGILGLAIAATLLVVFAKLRYRDRGDDQQD